ncbi:MAG: HDIG domain-containing protein [Bacteroidaceae bacterium]|nr:HDIG domain-containing protein [Bacteroidaceae bacterium]
MENNINSFSSTIDRVKDYIGKKSRKISRIILVALCIGLIIYFMPKQKSVYYDFKYNTPWAHEQLRAEFDFDVPKTSEDILAEKDSIKKQLIPIFKQTGTPNEIYKAAVAESYENNADIESLIPFFNQLKYYLDRGIIDDSDTLYLNGNVHNKILTYRDNNDKRRLESRDFVTVSKAKSELMAMVADTTGIISFVKPNYKCDIRESQLELEKQAKAINTIHKHVKEGERIISTGEIVDKEAEKVIKAYLDQKREKEKSKSANNWQYILIGQIIFIVVCMIILLAYISIYKKEIINNTNKFIFTIISATTFPIIVGIVTTYGGISVFALPFAILPITLCLFIDESTAFVTNSISVAMCSIMLTSPYEFVLLQILAGSSAILSLRDLSSRAQMFKCVLITFLTYGITYLCYKVVSSAGFNGISTMMYVYFIISTILTLFIYPLMFIIERTFGFISSVTLIELSNLNCKLLQRMSQEAPGTFQHSMQVGNLASEAAIAIGANPLEVRTGALYHDIGKLENPEYFTENLNGGISPHNKLSPIESAQVIIKHVTNGIATAEHEGLPKKIREFISTHHGVSKTGYFYITYKNEHPNENIDERLFTYPGPKPFTKEQAVLMLADCVEAASHSLKEYTEENISKLVDNIIDGKLRDGELEMSPLTFQDVHTIKTVFRKRLMAIYHTRISYPTEKKQ